MHINEAPGDLQNGVENQENECTDLVNEIKGTQDNASSFSCQAHLYWRSADSCLVYWCLVPVGNVRCLAHLVQTQCKRFTVPNNRINCPF